MQRTDPHHMFVRKRDLEGERDKIIDRGSDIDGDREGVGENEKENEREREIERKKREKEKETLKFYVYW